MGLDTLFSIIFWGFYVGSVPVIIYIMQTNNVQINDAGDEPIFYGVLNTHLTAAGINGLFIYPFILLLFGMYNGKQCLNKAVQNWIYLSCFEEVIFQIPHNVFSKYIYSIQGSGNLLEYPFYVYGLSDSEWNNYYYGSGLSWQVFTCNTFEGGSGLILTLLQIYLYLFDSPKNKKINNRMSNMRLIFILLVVFRDAGLFRQTVSYLLDQHVANYPYSIQHNLYRNFAVAGLYTINGLWIIAPMFTIIWAFKQIKSFNNQSYKSNKNNKHSKTKKL